ncbi:MAG: zinc ribbon domain-containing protein, partial [Ethanoligenens sp.]
MIRHNKTGWLNYLLSGKLYCGHCNAGMVGESGTGKAGAKHYYYICVNKKRAKTCDKKTVRKEWLEKLVVEATAKYVLQPEKIDVIAKKCVDIQAKDVSQNNELMNRGCGRKPGLGAVQEATYV